MNGGSLDDALGKCQEVIRLNRKRKSEEMDSDASAIIASNEPAPQLLLPSLHCHLHLNETILLRHVAHVLRGKGAYLLSIFCFGGSFLHSYGY